MENKIILKAILFIISIFFLYSLVMSCTPRYENLSLPIKEYKGKALRIDGWYYRLVDSQSKGYHVYILYRNGILAAMPGPNFEEGESLKDAFNKKFAEGKIFAGGVEINLKNRSDWGVFNIDKSRIKIEEWISPGIASKLVTYTEEGVILNDSTFVITAVYRSNGSDERRNINEVYHFFPLTQKPDSTNKFLP